MRSWAADKILERVRAIKTPYAVRYSGLHIQIDKDVYPPREDSLFLAKNLWNPEFGVKEGERVLDYGAGSGILSLVAANLGGKVIGVDINPLAVDCARYNAERNNLKERIEIRLGSFEVISRREYFDVVTANLPFEDSEPHDLLEYSLYDPLFRMRRNLFSNIREHLSSKGRIFFTYSERVQKIAPLEKFCTGFHLRIVDKRLIGDETYFLYLVT